MDLEKRNCEQNLTHFSRFKWLKTKVGQRVRCFTESFLCTHNTKSLVKILNLDPKLDPPYLEKFGRWHIGVLVQRLSQPAHWIILETYIGLI